MLESISVIRRCGKAVPLDIQKIRNVCQWACQKHPDCSPLELEGSLSLRLRDGITTKEIQDNLINCALEKCNLENPDWRYVAGRLHIWGYNQDVLASRGYGYTAEEFNPFVYHVVGSVQRNLYRNIVLRPNGYSRDELIEAQSWINPEWDYDYDYAGAVLLTNRYLQKDELIQEAYLTTALIIASVEKENRLEYARQFYEQVACRKISLATPILANLRAPGGNGTSCFIHTIDDNLESIFDEVKNAARISKNGGGVGTNLSKIRAAGSTVMGRANGSGGVIPWIKILNDTAVAVNQGGKRSGAITVSLDIWHLDILEFLEMQTENGDQRRKAYDVFPQIVIPDLFMEYLKERKSWMLFDPYEVKQKLNIDLAELWGNDFCCAYIKCLMAFRDGKLKLVKMVKALDLFKQIMKVQLESGLPYLAFKDTINRANPNKHEGYIPCTNLCVAGETLILTDKGEFPIKSLEGEFANIWNGFEWSNVLIRKTGENQKLLKVTVRLSNSEANSILYCTEYHKWHLIFNGEIDILETITLEKGDKIIPYFTPDGTEVSGEIIGVEDLDRFDGTYCFTEPKRHLGMFNGILTGQCTESYSNVKSGEEIHSCNLISINLATVESLTGAMQSCKIAVRMLDNTIDITSPPVKEAATHNQKYRTIGVGFMGLADYLAKRKLTYKDTHKIHSLFGDLSYACLSASADLAIERGVYPAFKGSEWALGNIDKIIPNAYDAIESGYGSDLEFYEPWRNLRDKITRTGIRNSHVMAIAPNTSSSLVHGCTASILPVYSRFFYDKASKGAMPVAPPFINESFWYYQENKTLDQKTVIDAVSTIQGWIDTGISMELVFNLNEGVYGKEAITAKDIFDTIFYAWEKGCKAIYYIRSVQKDNIKDDCTACAN